jgi:predicted acylesterase/phospholipase RssA
VLSGGGSNGAWEVGVLWGLAHYGNPEDFAYDWITGVSAGAINSAALTGFAPSEIAEATEFLSETFTTLTTDQIWRVWPEGLKYSVLNKPSLLDDSPAVEFMTNFLSDPRFVDGFKRDFTLGAVNVETGEYHTFTRDNITFGPELAQAAMASGSIPTVFEPRHF